MYLIKALISNEEFYASQIFLAENTNKVVVGELDHVEIVTPFSFVINPKSFILKRTFFVYISRLKMLKTFYGLFSLLMNFLLLFSK